MKSKKLENSVKVFEEALAKTSEALELLKSNKSDSSLYKALCDTAIKRFEVAFEYCWKLMKAALEFQGLEAPGPRPAIQEAIKFGYIKSPEFWAEALDARNGSVHDYFGISIDNYLKLINRFIKESNHFVDNIQNSN